MRISESVIGLYIRQVLQEEVFGAQAFVYHGTDAQPKELIPVLLGDQLAPGKRGGAMYGKGLYTVYDLAGSQTEEGLYGQYIYKLKVNLYGFIIFDPDVALKVYKKPLTPLEQAELLGYDDSVKKALAKVKPPKDEITSDAAYKASKTLSGKVKGIAFTGQNDGRVAVIYDASVAVPVAWQDYVKGKWNPVDRESLKGSLSRSAMDEWEPGKYTGAALLNKLAKMSELPPESRVIQGDLDLTNVQQGVSANALPDNLHVTGNMTMPRNNSIRTTPANLRVDGNLDMLNSVARIKPGLVVGGNLLVPSNVKSLPINLSVGKDLYLVFSEIQNLPKGLRVGGDLNMQNTPIKTLPPDIQVGGRIFTNKSDLDLEAVREDLKPKLFTKFWNPQFNT